MDFDAIIIGGGPAGASCGLWLKGLGFAPLIVEARDRLGGSQNDSPYVNSWVAGLGDVTGEAFAARIDAQLRAHGVTIATGCRASRIEPAGGGFAVEAVGADGPLNRTARTVVAATGVTPERGGLADAAGVRFGPGRHIHDIPAGARVAILGGGDNAFENYGFARAAGAASVTIFARTLRARPALRSLAPVSDVREGAYRVAPGERTVNGERFDLVFVFYGFRAETPYLDGLAVVRDGKGYLRNAAATAETDVRGLYAVGEVAARQHPCCVTAMADGVTAAKAIERRLAGEQ